ncbi:MAG: hypothetical protein A2X55_08930 [Nitrospirae bacterium GWB2_47_37]|nr:MAG: hypothetical protein A2X55_08930 [Nitrospirae bacterium GWB2_47_37]HAK87635.1 hypothetical protein [Nitrospiraceae bacterium]
MNLDIYTTGGIEILSQIFKGIVMILGDADFDGLLKLFAALGTSSAVIALAYSSRFQDFVKYFTFSFFIFTLCFGARANVTIIDTKFQQTYVVNSVPFLPAYATSVFSTGSYYITKLFQNVFHTGTVTVWNAGGPADNAVASVELDYERTGYGGFFDLLTLLQQMEFYKIANPDVQDFNSRLDAFLYQCTMPEISVLTQAQTEQRIKQAPDLWTAIKPQVNQFMDYGGLTTCVDFFENGSTGVYDLWNNKIKPMFEETGDTKILAFFGIQPSAILPFKNAITEAVQGGAVSLGDSIGQAGLIAALDKAYLRFVSDSPSAMQYLTLMYQTGRNVEEAKQMGRSLGLYAKEVIPYLKIAFEAICIVILPIIALLIFLPGYTFSSMKNYIFMSGTVYLWDPILAAINGLVNISYIAKLHTALQAANAQGVLNIVSYNTIAATMDFLPSVAGYLGMMAPGLAYGIVRGGMEVMFSTMASMMAGPVTSMPPHQEAASSIETQKIANQTGRSFGEVEMAHNAAGQSKLTSSVFQAGVSKYGYDKLSSAESGAFDYGVGQKMGQGDVAEKLGLQGIAGMTYKQTMMGSAETEGKWKGGGSDLENLQHAAALEAGKRLDFAGQVKRDYAGPGGSYVETKDGGIRDAKISNLNTSLEFSQRDALTRSAAKDLAVNQELMKTLGENKDFGESLGVDKKRSDALQEEFNHTLRDRLINNQNEFKFTGSNEEKETFFSTLRGGVGLKFSEIVGLNGEKGYRSDVIKSDGQSVGLTFSGTDATKFTEMSRKAAEDSIVKTASTREGLGYVAQLSERVGASNAYRDTTAAQSDEAVSRKMAIDVAPELLEHVRKTEYGHMDDISYARELSLNKIQNWRENNPEKLNDAFKAVTDATYNNLRPSDFGSLTSEVKEHIEASKGLKTEAMTAANRAEAKTDGITEGSLSVDPRVGIQGPDKDKFDKQDKAQQDAQKRATDRRKGKEGPPIRG